MKKSKTSRIVTITGDRQTGKTTGVLAIAAGNAQAGRVTVWVSTNFGQMGDAMDQLRRVLPVDRINVSHAEGRQRIILADQPGQRGGRIYFHWNNHFSARSYEGFRDLTFIFDDCTPPESLEEIVPHAFIYVTEYRPTKKKPRSKTSHVTIDARPRELVKQ